MDKMPILALCSGLLLLVLSLIQGTFCNSIPVKAEHNETESLQDICKKINWNSDADCAGKKYPILGNCTTYFECNSTTLEEGASNGQISCPNNTFFDVETMECGTEEFTGSEKCLQVTCESSGFAVEKLEETEETDRAGKNSKYSNQPFSKNSGYTCKLPCPESGLIVLKGDKIPCASNFIEKQFESKNECESYLDNKDKGHQETARKTDENRNHNHHEDDKQKQKHYDDHNSSSRIDFKFLYKINILAFLVFSYLIA